MTTQFRDPAGKSAPYAAQIAQHEQTNAEVAEGWDGYGIKHKIHAYTVRRNNEPELLSLLYGNGTPIEAIQRATVQSLTRLTQASAFVRGEAAREDSYWKDWPSLRGGERDTYKLAAFTLLLLPSAEQLKQVAAFSAAPADRCDYLLDVLIKSFVPEFVLAKKYKKHPFCAAWTAPVLRVLALPADERPSALAKHMKNWCRLMSGYGWSRDLVKQDNTEQWCDFAFEVALAVCAYDIDDSAFADHPYYPRELVNYYRDHLRQSRDGWRAPHAGAGGEIVAPPPPKKADLAKSKRKGLARWLELVSDGRDDAVEGLLEELGRPRKITELDPWTEALSGEGHAILADMKDDESVAGFAAELAQARGLGEFSAPAGPPQGIAGASATLRAFAEWTAERGYRLVDLDNGDDSWHVVLVKAEFAEQFEELSAALGITTRTPEQAYVD